MAILKRAADIKLDGVTAGAPVEYDTLVEIADALIAINSKLDLITITQPVDLDNLLTNVVGSIAEFEAAL